MPTDPTDCRSPGAVLFDLDGTLVDTVETRIAAWLQALEEAGLPTTRERLGPLIGARRQAARARDRGPRRAVSTTTGRRPSTSARARSTSERNRSPRPLPGVRELVDGHRERAACRWAIATSSRKDQVDDLGRGPGPRHGADDRRREPCRARQARAGPPAARRRAARRRARAAAGTSATRPGTWSAAVAAGMIADRRHGRRRGRRGRTRGRRRRRSSSRLSPSSSNRSDHDLGGARVIGRSGHRRSGPRARGGRPVHRRDGHRRGPSGGLLIEGEAGVGKSMLWRAAVDLARTRSLDVLQCAPGRGGAGALLRRAARPGRRLADGRDRSASGAATPGPRGRAAVAARRRSRRPGSGRRRADRGHPRRAADRPMLLAIDDTQWLDPPSARTLAFIAPPPRRCPRLGG